VREHRLAAEELTGDEIRRRFPAFQFPADFCAVVERNAGFLFVEDCVRAHIDAARALGAEVHANEPVREWKADGAGVEVTTDRGAYRAARLVVTAGAWATKLLADVGIPLRVMRQVLTWFDVRPRAESFRRDTFPVFLADVPGGPFYGLPALDPFGLKVARHYNAPELPDPDGVSWEPTADDGRAVRAFLDAHVPGVGGLTKAQVCMYTVTPDRHFVIDVHPAYPQVSVACGFSGHGFKFASTVGEILADLADAGRTAYDIRTFAARRFESS
jgi:sarcosine oxidase